MADALATLLVQEGSVTLEGLARAQARQRERGGSLDTALLELGLVDEPRLVATLSRATGLPAAPVEALRDPDLRSRRVFPGKVAERHGLAPFRLEGKELHLAASWPVDVAALDEISFMLSLHLVPHVAAEWRVWELRRRVYDAPLPGRYAALAGPKGEEAGPAPEAGAPEPPARTAAPAGAEEEPGEEGLSGAPFFAGLLEAPPEPVALPAPVPGVQPRATPPPLPLRPTPSALPVDEPLARALADALEEAEAAVGDPPAPVAPLPPAPAGALAPVDPRARPARWSLAEARQALAAAPDRDDAVVVLLRYALDFFEHAALLATFRGVLQGHDAQGAQPDARARARALRLGAGESGIVRAVLDTGGPYLGPPARDAVVEALLAGLGRSPRTMLLYPVQIRDRVVCLLYADNGEAPVSPGRVGDLLLLASEVGAALLRTLAVRKTSRTPAPAPAPAEVRAPAEPVELAWETLAPPAAEPAPQPPLAEVEAVAEEAEEAPPAGAPAASEKAPERPTLRFGTLASLDGALLEPEPPASEPAPPAPLPLPLPLPVPRAEAAEPPTADFPAPSAAAVPPGSVGPTLPPPSSPEDAGWADLAVAPGVAEAEQAGGADGELDAFAAPPSFDAQESVAALVASRRGSAERARLLARLALHGPESAAALAAALPGPLEEGSAGGEETRPLPERGPILEALCALDIVATPWLVEVLTHPEPRRRRYAALLLGHVGDPAAFLPLADRVFDADPAVADAALAALVGLRGHPDFRPVLERLRRALHGEPPRPVLAARALVQLGDAGAVGPLIGLLEGAPGTAVAAEEALAALTARRLGRDPSAWTAWWSQHRGQRRTDWLFAALVDEDREARLAAAEALRAVGPSPVRFFADAPEAERRRSAGEWREWFESHGLEA